MWVELKNLILSQILQIQKTSYCMIVMKMSKKGKSIKTGSRLVVVQSWMWECSVTADGHRSYFSDEGNVLRLEHSMLLHISLNKLKIIDMCT